MFNKFSDNHLQQIEVRSGTDLPTTGQKSSPVITTSNERTSNEEMEELSSAAGDYDINPSSLSKPAQTELEQTLIS